jgi:ankyrin repeat protein
LLLVNKADVNAKDNDGWMPLRHAPFKGCQSAAEMLLIHKADINARAPKADFIPAPMQPGLGYKLSSSGWTPLLLAISHKDVVELLLAYNADVNARNSRGDTPLHAAAAGGNTDVVALLLANKAEINAKENTHGFTPLHLAARKRNQDVIELLLAKGAEVNATSYHGTPLHYINSAPDATEVDYTDIMKLLRRHGGHE